MTAEESKMAITYSLDEVFEIAEKIERNGAAFYRRAADLRGDEPIRELFLKLAADEDKHEKTFHRLREQLVGDDVRIANYDKDETVVGYLQALAGSYIFNTDLDPAEELSGNASVSDILKTAMSKERDSITLYLGIRQVMADSEKKKVSQILQEEQKHLVDLIAALAEFGERNSTG